ncbi:MAG: hypothetical protein KJ919_03045 [Verrucomicrobia bacterium]|nr:hypothetical protein [Verrucomicrobiota bacterium]MBU4291971.1 hypothetical protein [Verrucomicrobiota bacterium]
MPRAYPVPAVSPPRNNAPPECLLADLRRDIPVHCLDINDDRKDTQP